ncbi:MAG TPA: K(+)-transporting ATPase subunit F [Candidatus Methylacidiphilales bacterium]
MRPPRLVSALLAVVTAGLFVYLAATMLWPEKF